MKLCDIFKINPELFISLTLEQQASAFKEAGLPFIPKNKITSTTVLPHGSYKTIIYSNDTESFHIDEVT